jgi:hypothetical protein
LPDQDPNHPSISGSSPSPIGWISESVSPYFLAVLLAYAAVRCICQAATKPFWFDEVCTFIMVRQPRISTLWSALKQGADVQPPGFYIAERLATALVANENIGFRLLSILGFLCTVVCLFVLVRKRRGGAVALLCAAVPLVTSLYDYFAVESRPYSLVVACIAFALVCYERAPAARWMILMGFSLALAQSFHYYAAISFFPFLASETAFLLAKRQLRWPVWFALGSGLLPIIPFGPLLWRSKAVYGAHFWSPPSLQLAESSYGIYIGNGTHTGIFVASATAIALLGATLYRIRRGAREESASQTWFQEPILTLAFLILPVVAVVLAMFAHGGMTAKYVLSTVLAFPLAVSYVFPRLGPKSLAPIAVLGIFLLGLTRHEKLFWSSYNGHFLSPADPVEVFVGSAGYESLPVVISDPQDFMPLSHYASPAWRTRFVSVVDAPQAVKYTGSDSADKEFPILASYFPLPVYDFQAFATEHPSFLLYSSSGGAGYDWWPRKLKDDGYTLRPVAVKPKEEFTFSHIVFLVSRSKEAD